MHMAARGWRVTARKMFETGARMFVTETRIVEIAVKTGAMRVDLPALEILSRMLPIVRKIAGIGVRTDVTAAMVATDGRPRWCQTKTDRSRKTRVEPSSGCELAPFGQGGGSVFLEIFAAIKVAFEVKVIVDGRLDGGELLQTSHRPEPHHDLLSSPEREM